MQVAKKEKNENIYKTKFQCLDSVCRKKYQEHELDLKTYEAIIDNSFKMGYQVYCLFQALAKPDFESAIDFINSKSFDQDLVNATDERTGDTPLFIAIKHADLKTVDKLISLKARIHQPNPKQNDLAKNTPFNLAISLLKEASASKDQFKITVYNKICSSLGATCSEILQISNSSSVAMPISVPTQDIFSNQQKVDELNQEIIRLTKINKDLQLTNEKLGEDINTLTRWLHEQAIKPENDRVIYILNKAITLLTENKKIPPITEKFIEEKASSSSTNFISQVLNKANKAYDAALGKMVSYARDVVNECPIYFHHANLGQPRWETLSVEGGTFFNVNNTCVPYLPSHPQVPMLGHL